MLNRVVSKLTAATLAGIMFPSLVTVPASAQTTPQDESLSSPSYNQQGRDWADTVAGAEICGTGLEQSPIDLSGTGRDSTREASVSGGDLMQVNGFGYERFRATVDDVELPTYKVNFTQGEFILNLFNGKKQLFVPKHFKLHAPSEHTVEGRHFDVELQLVHQYKGTNGMMGGIVAIFFDTGASPETAKASDFLASIFDVVDQGTGTVELKDLLLDVDFGTYWNYDGSLTEPPCDEGIKWTVIRDVQTMSLAQLRRIQRPLAADPTFAHGNGNNRDVQLLGTRMVYFSGAEELLATMMSFATVSIFILSV